MGLFGFGKKEKVEDKSTTIYKLLKSKIDDITIHTDILSKEIETSTIAKKLEDYNNEFLEFLNNLQTFENFFIHNKQINKINVLEKFLKSKTKREFLINLDKNTQKAVVQRLQDLRTLKENLKLANKTDKLSK